MDIYSVVAVVGIILLIMAIWGLVYFLLSMRDDSKPYLDKRTCKHDGPSLVDTVILIQAADATVDLISSGFGVFD